MSARPHLVYRLYDLTGVLLYVGVTDNWARRREQHLVERPWFPEVARMETESFGDRGAALARESVLIRSSAPRHNSLHLPPIATVREPGLVTGDEVTVEEAARIIGMHPGAIRRAIQAGRIKARRIGQRVYVIEREEAERGFSMPHFVQVLVGMVD